jgi:hypothetical protein
MRVAYKLLSKKGFYGILNKEIFIMKTLSYHSLIAGCVLLGSFHAAQAIPVLYTLEGNVTWMYDSFDIMDLSEGDPISYSFFIDDDITSGQRGDGRAVEYGESIRFHTGGSSTHNYRYDTEFAGGTEVSVDENAQGYNPQTGNAFGEFYASESYTAGNEIDYGEATFIGYGSNMFVQLSFLSNFSEWEVGAPIWTDSDFYFLVDDQGNDAYFEADFILTSASDTLPEGNTIYLNQPEPSIPVQEPGPVTSVPEPSTLLMIFTGLVGVISFRRKPIKPV